MKTKKMQKEELDPLKIDIVQPYVKFNFYSNLLLNVTKVFTTSLTSEDKFTEIIEKNIDHAHFWVFWVELKKNYFNIYVPKKKNEEESELWVNIKKIISERNSFNQISTYKYLELAYLFGKVQKLNSKIYGKQNDKIVELIKSHLIEPKVTLIID